MGAIASNGGFIAMFSRWALCFLMWFVCVLCTQPQNRFSFLYPFHIADIAVAGAVTFHFLGCGQSGQPFIRTGRATKLALILMAIGLIENYVGAMQTWTDWNSYIDTLFKSVLVLALAEAMCSNVARVWIVQASLLLATLWWVKAGLRLSAAGATYSGDRVMGPAVSLVENPNGFAYMMCVMIPLYLYFYQQGKSKFAKWFYIALTVAGVYIVLRTGSRTGMLCLIAVAIFLLPKYFAGHKFALIAVAASLVVLSSSIGALNVARFKSIPKSLMDFISGSAEAPADEMDQDAQSAFERKMKNAHCWRLIKRYPFFGVGMNPDESLMPEDLPYARGQVHCEILMAGRMMGLPGMYLYLALLYTLFSYGLKVQRYCAGWWPAVSDLGWTLKLQAVVFGIGGYFSPLPFNLIMMLLCGSASALWTVVQAVPAPAQAPRIERTTQG